MTAWCSSTTSVRKVRARSSEKLRALTFGAACTSVAATVWEIVVMRARPPARVIPGDAATGNRIQQGLYHATQQLKCDRALAAFPERAETRSRCARDKEENCNAK